MRTRSDHTTTTTTPPPPKTFCSTIMEDNVTSADAIITKWDPDRSGYAKATSIFSEGQGEARRFLRAISDLRRAMKFFVSAAAAAAESPVELVRAQRLMQVAMSRLKREFYMVLAANRERLNSESLSSAHSSSRSSMIPSLSFCDPEDEFYDDESRKREEDVLGNSTASVMSDLRAIAESMIANGYGKECFNIYKVMRMSNLDEGLHRLGFTRGVTASQLHKLDSDAVDDRMKKWAAAVPVAVRKLFAGERVLSDAVFGFSSSKKNGNDLKESCFAEITRDAAVHFFAFPELAATKVKKLSPEQIFQFLGVHDTLSELRPEIVSVFSSDSTSAVRDQVITSLAKLGVAVRSMLAEFESQIQKYASKDAVPGGGLHPLTRYVMNYLIFLADYSLSLSEIFADHPLSPADSGHLSEPLLTFINSAATSAPSSPSYLTEEEDFIAASPAISSRFAWMVLVLLCKLDRVASHYRDPALSYLFLANNLWYVAQKVKGSRVGRVLGEEWAVAQEARARSFARSCERLGWRKVVEAVPDHIVAAVVAGGAEAAKDRMTAFNAAFIEAYRKQKEWVVVDGRMRDELKVSIAKKVKGRYAEFYELFKVVAMREESFGRSRGVAAGAVRFAPQDVENYLSDLFYGGSAGGSSSGSERSVGSVDSGSGSSKGRQWRAPPRT